MTELPEAWRPWPESGFIQAPRAEISRVSVCLRRTGAPLFMMLSEGFRALVIRVTQGSCDAAQPGPNRGQGQRPVSRLGVHYNRD
jgi:hypothetical protein